MNRQLRVGIIGVGNMGAVHLGFFLDGKIKDAHVTAVADLNDAKLVAIKRIRPGDYTCFGSGEALVDSGIVDAVIIATPHYSHPELVVAALKRGLHVLCEKPTGVYTKQVKEMNEFAKTKSLKFGAMFNQRFNDLYIKMHDFVADGSLGVLKRINFIITNWYRPQNYYNSASWRATWVGEGGGVLINQSVHQLDLLQWIACKDVTKVSAFCHFGKWHDIEVEDDVTAYLQFEGGATASFVTSTGDTPGTNRFEVLGSKGKLLCEGGVLKFYKLKCDERDFMFDCHGNFGEPEYTVETFEFTQNFHCHTMVINNFVGAILGKEQLFIEGTDGLRSVEMLNAMLLSTWLGRAIDLPFDDDLYLSELNKRIESSKVKLADDSVIIDNSSSFGGF